MRVWISESKIQDLRFVVGVGGFQGGLVFKAYRCVYHSTLGSRVNKKGERGCTPSASVSATLRNRLEF